MYRRECGDRKVALVDVVIDQLQLILYPLEHLAEAAARFRRAALELEVGDQPPEPQHRRRGARLRVGASTSASRSASTDDATEPG